MSTPYDVVFVGTGISNTFTLVEILARLERQKTRFARVLLIDKSPDFFTGVPYGKRSGDVGLIISRLSDFLPASQFPQFGEWLAGHRDSVFERFFAVGGRLVDDWRVKYWHEVEAGTLAELYLPRYVVGLYFEHIARRAIERAHEQGVASCETLVGEVVDLDQGDGAFTLVIRQPGGGDARVDARRVVLGLGSTPARRILEPQSGAAPAPPGCVVIDDPFEPGIADMLERIRTAAHEGGGAPGRVLIVGSNAGALDVIFNLMNDPVIAAAISRLDVRSTSGKFPELFYAQPEGFRPPLVGRALKHLASRDSILADDILDAVRLDIESARHDGLTITDTFWDISAGFTSLLDRLSPPEKLRFAGETGASIGAMQRRVGQDYWGVVDTLMREGRLVVTPGRFPADDTESELADEDLLAVINCSGNERLSGRPLHSELMGNLLERARVRPTGSGLGIRVTDDLETDTPGLYAIGPMLTGNVLRDEPAWNLEHCGRIALFARQLAAHLVDREFAEDQR